MRWKIVTGAILLALAGTLGWNLAPSARPVHADDKAQANANLPVPKDKESNCVRCHLTAGRELTEAVHTFAHSVHDQVAEISCHDCHGGNLDDDATAHSSEFDFIGTKLSAHLTKCQSCHEDQFNTLAAGPHHWDHQKKLNIRYPLCVDCHGNHDVGNPPQEFSMSLVCTECHRGYKQKFSEFATLTDSYDQMWAAILDWQSKNPKREGRFPDAMEDPISSLRKELSNVVHASKTNADAIQSVVTKMNELTNQLRTAPAAAAGGGN